ncbi:uncharacterized protein LOC128392594 [Panonychus citri]|uniref:uncharacterized protein LOC128392594 n=1 Tax=Panonychus citri TaxID=50023 RepID=UPI00230829B1|nr:uncharacterized protein LOC128392594 [Panonychus citri]
MIKSIVFVILIFNLVSLTNCEGIIYCEFAKELVAAGTYEKTIKEIKACEKDNLPQYVYNTLKHCENLLPFNTNDEVIKVCSDIGAYEKKFEQYQKCLLQTIMERADDEYVYEEINTEAKYCLRNIIEHQDWVEPLATLGNE